MPPVTLCKALHKTTSLAELKSAIMGYLEYRNGHPKIYQWTAKPDDILAKIERAKNMLVTQH